MSLRGLSNDIVSKLKGYFDDGNITESELKAAGLTPEELTEYEKWCGQKGKNEDTVSFKTSYEELEKRANNNDVNKASLWGLFGLLGLLATLVAGCGKMEDLEQEPQTSLTVENNVNMTTNVDINIAVQRITQEDIDKIVASFTNNLATELTSALAEALKPVIGYLKDILTGVSDLNSKSEAYKTYFDKIINKLGSIEDQALLLSEYAKEAELNGKDMKSLLETVIKNQLRIEESANENDKKIYEQLISMANSLENINTNVSEIGSEIAKLVSLVSGLKEEHKNNILKLISHIKSLNKGVENLNETQIKHNTQMYRVLNKFIEKLNNLTNITEKQQKAINTIIGKLDTLIEGINTSNENDQELASLITVSVEQILDKIAASDDKNAENWISLFNNFETMIGLMKTNLEGQDDLKKILVEGFKNISDNIDITNQNQQQLAANFMNFAENILKEANNINANVKDSAEKLMKAASDIAASINGVKGSVDNVNNTISDSQLAIVNTVIAQAEALLLQSKDNQNNDNDNTAKIIDLLTSLINSVKNLDANAQNSATKFLEAYQTIIDNLQNLDANQQTFAKDILTKYDIIIKSINNIGATQQEAANNLLAKFDTAVATLIKNINNLDTNQQAAANNLLAKFDEVINKLNTMDANAQANTMKILESNAAILNKLNSMDDNMQKNAMTCFNKLNTIIDYLQNLDANQQTYFTGMSSMMEKLLKKDALTENDKVILNKIFETVNNIKVEGGTVNIDMTPIKEMLAELLEAVKSNSKILTNIDAKMDVINITISTAKDEIVGLLKDKANADNDMYKNLMAKLDGLKPEKFDDSELLNRLDAILKVLDIVKNKPEYDDTELMKKLDKIFSAIVDHNVEVTVDVTGKVTCECKHDGSNNEGVIDSDYIFN